MEQLAAPGSILLTAGTLRLAGPHVEVRPLGPVPIRGLATPVEVYELLGASTSTPRLLGGGGRELSPFVGRDPELERLQATLLRAGAGQGALIAIVGAPGLGKTRLCHELARWAAGREWLLLEASGVSYGRTTPYLPVVELLRGFFGLEARDDARRVTAKVIGRLLGADPGLEAALPGLLALLDIPVDDPGWQALDPPQRRRRTLDMLERLWIGASRARPLCIILENLHWIDAETQAVLDGLVESLPAHRLLLVVTYRPEYRHGWAGAPSYAQITLEPLSRESARRLARSLVGDDATLRPALDLLVERAAGNPLFLEEMLRDLVETGVLAGERGAYRLAGLLRAPQIPPTVQAVLAARIDRLAPGDKALLQCAAVIGQDVPLALLETIAGLEPPALREGVARLQTAEFLYATSLFPDPEYAFTHALTHDVAYASLLLERRRLLHQAVVRTIEARGPAGLAEQVDTLAHHAFRGELWAPAAAYLTQAGLKAFARSAHGAAAARFREAIAALDRLPESPAVLGQRIDARLALRNALLPSGQVEEVMARLGEAAALAERTGDRTRGSWVSGYMSACHWSVGDYGAALTAAGRTLAVGRERQDTSLCLYASIALTWIHHSLGDYAVGVSHGREALALLGSERLTTRLPIPSLPAVLARTWLVSCLVELGDFGEAAELADEELRLAEVLGEPWSLADASLGLGIYRLRRSEPAEAARVLERGIDLCHRYGIAVWLPPLLSSLGHARALTGRTGEAVTLLETALERAGETGLRFYRTLAEIWLAEALALDGRPAEAERRATAALELAVRYGEAGNQAYVLRVLGEVRARDASGGADLAEAGTRLRQALALATARGMRPLAGRCQLDLARVLARTGACAEAGELATSALDVFRDLGLAAEALGAERVARDLALSRSGS
jgi:tetratricopeptide (TPR) repeat protein